MSKTVHPPANTSHGSLSAVDAIIIMVGLVIGIGIFRTPSIVAANVGNELEFVLVWIFGGLATLIGALCYAELAAAYPHSGGEYHFLSKAYGKSVAVLFGWARGTVMQTGAIAAVAFVLGDYLAQLFPVGEYGPAIFAALSIIVLTAINVIGTRQSKHLQIIVTALEIAAVVAIILTGFLFASHEGPPVAVGAVPSSAALGLAMIFVLLTYGGWTEVAYLTGEIRDARRSVAKVLIVGTGAIGLLYVAANLAMLSVLGLDGLRSSDAVAADMMRTALGPAGAAIVSVAVAIAAISTLNATIFTGGRVYYAMACDLTLFPKVAHWNERGKTPANALVMQAAIALSLVGVGTGTRDGFQAMVDYTAPVFWGFLLLIGLALFILRWREPDTVRPFSVPLYPLTPVVFCLTCAYMLHGSLAYTGFAAFIGVSVLLAGTPLLRFQRSDRPDRRRPLPVFSKPSSHQNEEIRHADVS
ncbi:amino acid permease (plasmid) [Agrobacterium salinitolerans]|uniref:APC family permease n=1 Tax=Agrobacterium salinitolerans TaxID=1183413 RepID=UPI001C22FD11|nr:amino acid permease [Agrobacterium salinitolerans]QXC53086.1 amino acid permease [Agrobacterium salinitolerans]